MQQITEMTLNEILQSGQINSLHMRQMQVLIDVGENTLKKYEHAFMSGNAKKKRQAGTVLLMLKDYEKIHAEVSFVKEVYARITGSKIKIQRIYGGADEDFKPKDFDFNPDT